MQAGVAVRDPGMPLDRGDSAREGPVLGGSGGRGFLDDVRPVELDGNQTGVNFALLGEAACRADLDGDGDLDAEDFFGYLDAFASGNTDVCDLDGDGDCDAEDFFAYLDLFAQGC